MGSNQTQQTVASADQVALPRYDDLPEAPLGGRSAWGLFGADDQLGLVNLMTPDRVRAAAQLVRRGAMFPLNAPLGLFDPAIAASRGIPRHQVLHVAGTAGFDDVLDNFYPQASSQWDSLAHAGYAPDAFYNGATEAEVAAGQRNTIDHWARHGIAGRAVVLDMERLAADEGRDYDPGTSTAYSVDDLERARARTGLEFGPGDIVVLHTGFGRWWAEQDRARRTQVRQGYTTPGIAHGEDMCRYLWDLHIAAIVSDTFAVEVFPSDPSGPLGSMHRMLIGQFGMALGELWWTDGLAADCAADGVYECLLTAAPLNIPGGIGSSANALAVK